MRGRVVVVNPGNSRAVVEYGPDDCAVIELMEFSELGAGDVLTRVRNTGNTKLVNETRGEPLSIYVRRFECTMSEALAEAGPIP